MRFLFVGLLLGCQAKPAAPTTPAAIPPPASEPAKSPTALEPAPAPPCRAVAVVRLSDVEPPSARRWPDRNLVWATGQAIRDPAVSEPCRRQALAELLARIERHCGGVPRLPAPVRCQQLASVACYLEEMRAVASAEDGDHRRAAQVFERLAFGPPHGCEGRRQLARWAAREHWAAGNQERAREVLDLSRETFGYRLIPRVPPRSPRRLGKSPTRR
ncbi:MAG: hypothetical protein KJO07_15895 [Deltaproteobacteria bacterium]|nr:hypothetical protein [Deltaproteobacteria bacterium]